MSATDTTLVGAAQDAPSLRRRVIGQGALLSAGFGLSQVFSFARNALLGYWLTKGDFGIAITITLALQLLETLSDLGADRLIVQAENGEDAGLVATLHATLIARGLATALVLYLVAAPAAAFFGVAEAQWAFEVAALVPAIKGFLHLDNRLQQRRLDNRPFMLVEVLPQAAALALTLPALHVVPDYAAVVVLALAQALLAVATSHLIAGRPYRVGWDGVILDRLVRFGWPIWLSAIPLIAVYQGDRLIVGKVFGMEALAGYSAAFMITMVPGLLAAKVGNALLLPVLSACRHEPGELLRRLRLLSEAAVVFAAIFLAGFLLAGGRVLPWAFGPQYKGLDVLVAWLALMWALRIIQVVPGMALLAAGDTRPLLVAGCIRAAALPLALAAALGHGSITATAAAGCVGEIASLVYVAVRAANGCPGFSSALLGRTLFLCPALTLAGCALALAPASYGTIVALALALATTTAIAGLALVVLPGLRAMRRDGAF